MEFKIKFSMNYEHKFIDFLSARLSKFYWMILLCVFSSLLGMYLVFIDNENATFRSNFIGYLFILLGVGLLFSLPFILFFGKVNRGINNDITITFSKKNDIVKFKLKGLKNHTEIIDEGEVSLLRFKKYIVEFSKKDGQNYFIPLRVLSEENIANLKKLCEK